MASMRFPIGCGNVQADTPPACRETAAAAGRIAGAIFRTTIRSRRPREPFEQFAKKFQKKFRIPEPRAQMPIYKCIIRKEEPCGALFFGYFGAPFSPIGIFSVWISGFFVLSCNCNHPLGTKKIDTYFLKLPRNPLFPSRKNRTKSSITCLQAFGPNGRNPL